jgi:hypothetical protein
LRQHLLNDEQSIPDVLRELNPLVIEPVHRPIEVQEGVSEGISNGHGENAQHGVNRGREVLPAKGDNRENRPDEHPDN